MNQTPSPEEEARVKFINESAKDLGNYLKALCQEKDKNYSLSIVVVLLEKILEAEPEGWIYTLRIIHCLTRASFGINPSAHKDVKEQKN